MTKYIWQKNNWTQFTWNQDATLSLLLEAKKSQGLILAQAEKFELKELAEIIVDEAFTTSKIEGEDLDRNSIRSSVAKRLGLPSAGLPSSNKYSEGLVELLIDATSNYKSDLSAKTLYGWQASLFPTGFSGIHKIKVGCWRSGPIDVISGPMGREKVHYSAPKAENIPGLMKDFITWFNKNSEEIDGIIRAAIVHLWFITIHPFEDGNGRIARAITDMALAQDEKTSKRLYSLSTQIIKNKKSYYDILEKTQKGNGDITDWLIWFLNSYINSIKSSEELIEKSIFISNFFRFHRDTEISQRQLKVIKKLLEDYPDNFGDGITNKKYVSITKVSSETAKRDLKDLVGKGVLILNPKKGRSTSYRLNRDLPT